MSDTESVNFVHIYSNSSQTFDKRWYEMILAEIEAMHWLHAMHISAILFHISAFEYLLRINLGCIIQKKTTALYTSHRIHFIICINGEYYLLNLTLSATLNVFPSLRSRVFVVVIVIPHSGAIQWDSCSLHVFPLTIQCRVNAIIIECNANVFERILLADKSKWMQIELVYIFRICQIHGKPTFANIAITNSVCHNRFKPKYTML